MVVAALRCQYGTVPCTDHIRHAAGRRRDGFQTTWATNGYHPDLGSFMLGGVEIPAPGCWELTGHYKGYELSFVIWVTL
jgi:hypothetical protein